MLAVLAPLAVDGHELVAVGAHLLSALALLLNTYNRVRNAGRRVLTLTRIAGGRMIAEATYGFKPGLLVCAGRVCSLSLVGVDLRGVFTETLLVIDGIFFRRTIAGLLTSGREGVF